jgi:hypothetical protein
MRSEVAGLRRKAGRFQGGWPPFSQRHLKDFDPTLLIPPTPLGNQGGERSVSLSRSEAGSEATVGGGKRSFLPQRADVGSERADEPPALTEARAWMRKSVDD